MTKLDYVKEGNFKSAFPQLYNLSTNTMELLNENQNKIREAVAKKITVNVLRSNCDYLNWEYVCSWRKMNESEIREFKDFVHWDLIKVYQLSHLDKDFRREFEEILDNV